MRIVITIMIMLMSGMTWHIKAQKPESVFDSEKEIIQEKLDSIIALRAEKAVNQRKFVIEADRVEFKYGETVYVNSNTNFVSVDGDKSVVQVAFNGPISGPNGIGGITLDGTISNFEQKKDKKGNIIISMNVMGSGISALININMYVGSNKASVTILPNFNSNRLTLTGVVVPLSKSRVYKGSSI